MDKRKEYTPEQLWNSIQDNVKHNFDGKYVPENFWSEMGKQYRLTFASKDKNETQASLGVNLPELVSRICFFKPKRVLDVGCGFGRVAAHIAAMSNDTEEIIGIDFSSTMIADSENFLRTLEDTYRKKLQLINADAKNIPFEDHSFDLVYTHVCLTHIPPKYIRQVVSEISRVARNHIIHFERFNYEYEHPNPHRWSHALAPKYVDLGWDIIEYDTIGKEAHHTKSLVLRR